MIAEAAQLISRYHFTFAPDADWIDAFVPPVPGPLPAPPAGADPDQPRAGQRAAPAARRRLRGQLVAGAGGDGGRAPTPRITNPEGDVWEHTLATFAHRKSPDLVLSLGLLPARRGQAAGDAAGRQAVLFAHADIGARVARRFSAGSASRRG